jgi:hypothetical protein
LECYGVYTGQESKTGAFFFGPKWSSLFSVSKCQIEFGLVESPRFCRRFFWFFRLFSPWVGAEIQYPFCRTGVVSVNTYKVIAMYLCAFCCFVGVFLDFGFSVSDVLCQNVGV